MKIITVLIVAGILLFWQLDSLVSWLIVGLFMGLIIGWYTDEFYERDYHQTKQELIESGINLDATRVIGEKTGNIFSGLLLGLIIGVALYGIDYFLSRSF